MPRKSKVTSVPIDQEEGLARAWGDEEAKTDAERMTELVNEISVESEPTEEEPREEEREEPKPKAKRAPRKRAESVAVEVATTVDDAQVEDAIAEDKTDGNTKQKVSCPDCGKQMSAKTLKYSHGPNCVIAKRQADSTHSIPDEIIEQEVQKRFVQSRADRLARKQEAVSKLVANAF
jgi:hypothetical protein